MYQIGLAVMSLLLLACNGQDKQATNQSGESGTEPAFSNRFETASLPYQLSDTALLNNRDTATLPAKEWASFVPDTVARNVFGKTTGIRYTPLAKLKAGGKDAHYVVKATSGSKKAALLLVFDGSGNHSATIPFLIPDNNAYTAQESSIDKSFVITRAITEKSDGTVAREGKEVLAWDGTEKKFSLIMTDMLNDNPAVLVNPLDTFPKTHRLAGDYYQNDKNLVAVRDGRYPNQILVYIHTENNAKDCIGELKGEFIMTGTTTAMYRQGGDPCVLTLSFAGNKVTMNEERGCGNYRGLDCPLSGTFTRKKEKAQTEKR